MANNPLQVEAPASMRGGEKVAETTEEILDILDQTDENESDDEGGDKASKDEKPVKKTKEGTRDVDEEDEGDSKKKGDKEEEDEEKEDKLEEDETEKEDKVDELVTPIALKEITTKYPNILKEFPFLEKVYYREKKFTEIFPTVQDAREAVERLENVASIEQEVLSGKTETILKAIKESNPHGFAELVDDYLPALERVHPGAQAHIASNIVRGIVLRMYNTARDDNQKNAALVLSDYFWPGQNPMPPQQFSNPNAPPKQDEKLTQERQNFENQRFEYAAVDLNSRVLNQLKATIDNNIDKENVMTAFIKKNAITEVQAKLEEVLTTDSRFMSHINTLWQRAKAAGYSRSHMDNIRSAYLGKAKTVLAPIIVKVRNEALKGVRRAKPENNDEDKRGPIPTGRSAAESNNKGGNKKSIPQGMSVEDYIMSD